MWQRFLIRLLVAAATAVIVCVLVLDVLDGPRGWFTMGQSVMWSLIEALPALGWTAAGFLLAGQRPRNILGWLFLTGGVVLSSAELFGSVPVDYSAGPEVGIWQCELASRLTTMAVLGVPIVVLPLYPDGRLPARWWRWPVGVGIAGVALDGAIGMFLVVPAAVAILTGTVVRWWRAASPHRQQLAWFVGCGLVPYAFALGIRYSALGPVSLHPGVFSEALVLIPVGVAVGVLRYRLLGIEVVLRRGLAYGALTVLVFTAYLVVTAVLSRVLADQEVPAVVAAAIAAAGLAPARERLQQAADRLVYGARSDPLRALAELSDTVAARDNLALVQAALATVATAVRAGGATIVTPDGKVLASTGVPPARYLTEPLRFGGVDIGELRVAELPAGERYLEADHRLLAALAAQLAVVVSATELTEALETERNRVVAATRDERDRLRRDLHDGLGPSLTGMSLGLQALGGLVGDGNTPAGALVHRLRAETDTAVRDIRRIIDGLRPTVLDTVHLAQAVERHASTLDATLPVEVTAGDLPALAPDVEVAAYRIITEALTNAARHAGARHAHVTITAGEALHIAVTDDGHGMHTDGAGRGVGLSSMRGRAEALGGGLAIQSTGGGTTVTATLPLSS